MQMLYLLSHLPTPKIYIKLYEQGMKLLAQCNSEIDRVEKKLIILQEEADETADGQENM